MFVSYSWTSIPSWFMIPPKTSFRKYLKCHWRRYRLLVFYSSVVFFMIKQCSVLKNFVLVIRHR